MDQLFGMLVRSPKFRAHPLEGDVIDIKSGEILVKDMFWVSEPDPSGEWKKSYRLLIIRKRIRKQIKGPLQLDLFRPLDYDYEYKVIATNKTESAEAVLNFHNGRGSQEKLFGEAKQHVGLDLIPTRRKVGNQLFTLAGMLAHNLGRELQMTSRKAERGDLAKRPARWEFQSLGRIRQLLIHNAGTLTKPQGELTLTMNANETVRNEMTRYLDALLKKAA